MRVAGPLHSSALVVVLVLAGAAAAGGAREGDDVEVLQEIVRTWAGPPAAAFDEKEWARLSSGQPIAMIADSDRSSELSAIGAIRIDVSPDQVVERFRAIETVERGSTVLQIARFSDAATAEDVRRLTLDEADVRDIASCRPGDCGVQLSQRFIERAQTALASAGETADTANRLFREYLVDLVRGYRLHGDSVLEPYVDRGEPLSVAGAFAALDSGRRVLAERVPAIARDIAGYPRTRPAGSHEFFYWSKLRFGFKPTVRVNHVLVCPVQNQPNGLRYLIVSKQLYASHYFDAALEWRMIVADRTSSGSVMVYRTDVRSRTLSGFGASLFRGVVRSRARAGLERYLLTVKGSMEKAGR